MVSCSEPKSLKDVVFVAFFQLIVARKFSAPNTSSSELLIRLFTRQSQCTNLLAQRPSLQRGEDELVVAPDQLIGPALLLSAPRIKQVLLHPGFRTRLIDLL